MGEQKTESQKQVLLRTGEIVLLEDKVRSGSKQNYGFVIIRRIELVVNHIILVLYKMKVEGL